MRLSNQEIQQITQALEPFTKNQAASLYLYGSRVDDNAKGGDIDLLLLCDLPTTAGNLKNQKHKILSAIKKHIGDQRIDLKIASKKDLQTDEFLQLIMPEAVLL